MASQEWELARRLATPEERGQTDLVRWLERPIAATDKRAITERYEALRILFGTMGPPAAHRLHQRMTDQRDPLGEFARLELAEWHRQQLISLLASRARGFDRGVMIRGTTPPPDPPKPSKDNIITGRPPYIPPPISAPKPPQPIPKPPTPLSTPTPPKFDPKTIYVNIDPAAESWLASSLSGMAKMAGVGLSMLMAVIPAGVLEKAVQAAWLVYQLERLPAKALLGLAGEMATETIAVWVLENKMGIPVSKILNLNLLEKNFIGLDLLAPELPVSVKTYGVLSAKTGEALEKYLLSKYKNDAMYLFDTNHTLHIRYQEKVANRLLKHRDTLKQRGVWSSSLSGDVDTKRMADFVRNKSIMMMPADHVEMVRRRMALEYFTQYQEGKLPGFKPGLPDEVIAPQISELVSRRFVSSGLRTSDYRAIADVAGRLPEARDAVAKRGKKNWPKEWGNPPTWTGTVMRP
jgi:hypothetical protein